MKLNDNNIGDKVLVELELIKIDPRDKNLPYLVKEGSGNLWVSEDKIKETVATPTVYVQATMPLNQVIKANDVWYKTVGGGTVKNVMVFKRDKENTTWVSDNPFNDIPDYVRGTIIYSKAKHMSLTEITTLITMCYDAVVYVDKDMLGKTADWYFENTTNEELFETWWNNFDDWYGKKVWD